MLTALAISVAVLVATSMLQVVHRAHEDSLRSSLEDAGQVAAHSVSSFLQFHRQSIEAAASVMAQMNTPAPEASALLAKMHNAHPGFLTMIVTDAAGEIVAASPSHSFTGALLPNQGISVADREYFIAARNRDSVYVSDVFRGRGFGDDIIVAMSRRMNDPSGQFAGIVQGALDLSRVSAELGDTDNDPYSYVIVDNKDRAVYASSTQTIEPLDSVADRDWLTAGRARPPGDVFTLDEDGRQWFGVFVPIDQGWTIGVATPNERLYQYGTGTLTGTLMLLVLVSILVWGLARLLARRVSQPVAEVAQAMIRTNLDDPAPSMNLPDAGSREVQVLVRSLQTLLSRLADSHRQIKEALTRESSAREMLQAEMEDREQIIDARTLELHEANMALEKLIRQDGLTGLGNRRLLDERLTLAWDTCSRNGEWLAVVLVDIDHFKSFNDTYGHQAGDVALKKVARQLQRCAHRASDLAARYGGEEFCVLLPRTPLEGAERFGNFAVDAVRQLELIHGGGIGGVVTISAGAAAMRPQAGGRPADLVALADKALYRAKAEGRDRCVRAQSAHIVDRQTDEAAPATPPPENRG